jgi:hypothetical protein
MYSQPGGQGQYGPAQAPRHHLSFQNYDQEDDLSAARTKKQ